MFKIINQISLTRHYTNTFTQLLASATLLDILNHVDYTSILTVLFGKIVLESHFRMFYSNTNTFMNTVYNEPEIKIKLCTINVEYN